MLRSPDGMDRFGRELVRAALQPPKQERELRGARGVVEPLRLERALLSGHLDVHRDESARRLLESAPAADDLRLPPPPHVARSARELVSALEAALEVYARRGREPVRAAAGAVVAEARLMALLGGLRAAQREVLAGRDGQQPG
jgi:hypothetical protein